MSEIFEAFGAIKELGRIKRNNNKISSTGILTSRGIDFISKSNGVHLVVKNRWDFWPSTGLFIDRKNQKRGRGIKNLLRIIK